MNATTNADDIRQRLFGEPIEITFSADSGTVGGDADCSIYLQTELDGNNRRVCRGCIVGPAVTGLDLSGLEFYVLNPNGLPIAAGETDYRGIFDFDLQMPLINPSRRYNSRFRFVMQLRRPTKPEIHVLRNPPIRKRKRLFAVPANQGIACETSSTVAKPDTQATGFRINVPNDLVSVRVGGDELKLFDTLPAAWIELTKDGVVVGAGLVVLQPDGDTLYGERGLSTLGPGVYGMIDELDDPRVYPVSEALDRIEPELLESLVETTEVTDNPQWPSLAAKLRQAIGAARIRRNPLEDQ